MKRSFAILSLIFVIFIFSFTGCAKQNDTTPESVTRSSYLGNWNVTDSTLRQAYTVNITADPNSSDGVFISRFANLGSSATAGAVVKGNSIILDANQVISDIIINGSGTLSGTKINWQYTLNTGADLSTIIAVYTK